MKKVICLLIICFCFIGLYGCDSGLKSEVKLIVPNGTPFIAIADLLNEKNMSIENIDGAVGLKTALLGETYDIVIAPLNLGTQLYTLGNSKYILDSVIAFGNTYIISKQNIQLNSINDLNGKKLIAYGEGGAPDTILKYALNVSEVDAEIEYQNAVSDIVPFFVQGTYDYALVAEPIISKLIIQRNINLNILDLEDIIGENTIMQAAIFVNPNSIKQDDISKVINKIKENIKKMNADPQEYANKIVSLNNFFSDLTEEVIASSIPKSNLGFLKAYENTEKIENYLTLINYNLPVSDFYRQK